MLVRLIYASRMASGFDTGCTAMVEQILAKSRLNNSTLGVTGMLLTHAGVFLQALEGNPVAVDATFSRVHADRRHRDVKVIERQAVSDRCFGQWAMCAGSLSSVDTEVLKVLELKGRFDPHSMTPAAALKLMSAIAAIQVRHVAGVLQPV